MKNKNYIIVEIIPTASNPKYGVIAQLSALKLNGLVLKERFDYRLKEEMIPNQDILRMINYDKEEKVHECVIEKYIKMGRSLHTSRETNT